MCDEIYCSEESGSSASAEVVLLPQGILLDSTNHRLDKPSSGDRVTLDQNLTGGSKDKPINGTDIYKMFVHFLQILGEQAVIAGPSV